MVWLVQNERLWNDGYRLGSWISANRKVYKAGKLSTERKKMLEDIGVIFNEEEKITSVV